MYYGTRGRLEYDFAVGAAGDVAQIRLKFAGADPMIADNGDLVLSQNSDSDRAVRFQRPVVYQDIDRSEALVQPAARELQFAIHCGLRCLQKFCGFFCRRVEKESQLDHARFSRIDLLQFIQRPIDIE